MPGATWLCRMFQDLYYVPHDVRLTIHSSCVLPCEAWGNGSCRTLHDSRRMLQDACCVPYDPCFKCRNHASRRMKNAACLMHHDAGLVLHDSPRMLQDARFVPHDS